MLRLGEISMGVNFHQYRAQKKARASRAFLIGLLSLGRLARATCAHQLTNNALAQCTSTSAA